MPLLVALAGILLEITKPLLGRILLALGVSFVVYSGFNITINSIIANIKSGIGGLPAEILSFFAYMWIDRAIGVLFSAYTACMTIKMATSGSIKKMVLK